MKKNVLTTVMIFLMVLSLQAQKNLLDKVVNSSPHMDTDAIRPYQPNYSDLFASGPVKLNQYFKADDGSIVCIRQIKDKVYAIADRMDRRAASVWVGSIERNTVKVKYFYIPKGKAKGSGSLEFKVNGKGRAQTLTLNTSGSNKLKSANFNFKSLKALTTLPTRLPVNERAWYRGNTLNNLTGRWTIKNVGQEYILDLGKQVLIYTVGGRKSPNSRPQFSTLFIGDRNGSTIKGFYVDLPLGHTHGFGNTSFGVVGPHFIRASYDHFYYGVDRVRIKEDKNEILN